MNKLRLAVFFLLASLGAAPLDEATRKLAHDILQQLIEINTTDSVGSTTIAAEAMSKRVIWWRDIEEQAPPD
jgi:hypothetical protein